MPAPSSEPLTRSKARICVLINQGAFPGLGTVMAGRAVGYVQAVVMVAGFVLAMGFMLCYLLAAYRYATGEGWSEARFKAAWQPYVRAGWWGLALCVAAWLWALVSSLSILHAARHQPPTLLGREGGN